MAELSKIKHIHILAISGQGMTTPIALDLKKRGYVVTGSDQQKIYPPASTLLKHANIPVNTIKISKQIDLAIIGSGYSKFTNCKREFDLIKNQKIPYLSATDYVAQNIVKKNSIIVAGAYGKTTTAGLIVWILKKAGLNPSYLVGGKLINRIPSATTNSSSWSVVEGDESINGLDTKAKFLYYKTKYVILTSAYWEHKESYSTKQKNLDAYKNLVKNIPKDGVLVYNSDDPDLKKLANYCSGLAIPYKNDLNYQSPLIGRHNSQNIALASTLAHQLQIPDRIIKQSIRSYKGICRRLQVIGQFGGVIVIDDFAQSPPRILSSLQAIKETYPDCSLKVFFEPHASFLQNIDLIKQLKRSFDATDLVIMSQIPHKKNSPNSNRVSFSDFKKSIGPKVKYLPLEDQQIEFIQSNLAKGDVFIHMSSGGKLGLNTLKKIIFYLKFNN